MCIFNTISEDTKEYRNRLHFCYTLHKNGMLLDKAYGFLKCATKKVEELMKIENEKMEIEYKKRLQESVKRQPGEIGGLIKRQTGEIGGLIERDDELEKSKITR